jgi:hypothetical protein
MSLYEMQAERQLNAAFMPQLVWLRTGADISRSQAG